MVDIFLVILCVLAALMLAFAVYIMLFSRKKDGISIHVNEKSELQIIQSDEGIRLDIVYQTYEERAPSYEMLPDLVEDVFNDAVNSSAPSNDFWLEVASLNELAPERSEAVVAKLEELGFIKKEQMNDFIYPQDAEPTASDPADDEPAPGPTEQQGKRETSDTGKAGAPSAGPTQETGFKFNEFNL